MCSSRESGGGEQVSGIRCRGPGVRCQPEVVIVGNREAMVARSPGCKPKDDGKTRHQSREAAIAEQCATPLSPLRGFRFVWPVFRTLTRAETCCRGFAANADAILAAAICLACLLFLVAPVCVHAQTALPQRTQKGDIQIWDEQYLRGPPKGWTVPADYHEIFGRSIVSNEIRYGRFGLLSGQRLYTSWRPIIPLTDEQYAQGKVKLLDSHTSEVLTPAFEIKLDYVTFLISGGNTPGEACVNLLVDGKVVRSATGTNNDTLEWAAFDVKAFKGKQAQIQVLDTSTQAFGYITIDCVYQSVDPKGASRVIAQAPAETAQGAGSVQTVSGTTGGKVEFVGETLNVAGRPVDLAQMIRLRTGVAAKASDAGSRVQLSNGDVLAGDITGLEEKKLALTQPMLGQLDLYFDQVAHAIFMPGPTVQAKPGTLVQINNNLIPGKLRWIREDNIAIDCSLGLVPLPRTRVRSFVFTKVQGDEGATDRIAFADGSVLSGQLAVNDQGLLLKHALLGDLTLDLKQVARITRRLPNVHSLTELRGEIAERVGPIPPPASEAILGASGQTLRMFPGTVMRYALPASNQPRRLRAELMPLAAGQASVKVTVRVNGKATDFSVAPGADAHAVDLDLGTAAALEIQVQVDASQAIVFPSGIEWRNALIVEANAS